MSEAWIDESEWHPFGCPLCGGKLVDPPHEESEEYDTQCVNCNRLLKWDDFEDTQPDEYSVNKEGIIAYCDGPDIYFARSTHFTFVTSLCSPCAPNSGDLESGFQLNGYPTYCPPPDWFTADNPAPFPILEVPTGGNWK